MRGASAEEAEGCPQGLEEGETRLVYVVSNLAQKILRHCFVAELVTDIPVYSENPPTVTLLASPE